jgi:gallate decarboxylase subunit C
MPERKNYDLRSVLELLKGMDGHYIETDEEVNPDAQLSGVYRYVGAGGTVKRPTKEGPAMMFNTVKGFPGTRVLIGLLASRKRVAAMFETEPKNLGKMLNEAVSSPVSPVTVSREHAPAQEVVHLATDPEFDVRKLVPAPTNTPEDAGPYITMGMVYGNDPETGETDVTIHRLCLQSKDEISMYIVPGGRHLGAFYEKYEAMGKPMPVTVSIGVDPAIEIGACFEPPTTPLGYDELCVAGSIRKQPVQLVKALTVDQKGIANAEWIIEGELLPGYRVVEDQNTNTGKAMPEFPGYTGAAQKAVPVIKVKAVTHRKDNPIMQTVIGPSEEHVSMAGIPTEASIMQMVDRAMPGKVLNVYAHSSGGGKYVAVIQFKKTVPSDEGKQRQAALLAFSAFSELKHIILVDEDVDIFDTNDVLWAMTTRFEADKDIVTIPATRCHPLDPSQDREYTGYHDSGLACKTIFDCTVPFELKSAFQRSAFLEVDNWERFLK